MSLAERSARRRARMVVHRASSFEEAERWDLEYWQSRTPAERLSALVAIHRDIAKILKPVDGDAPHPQEDAPVLSEVKRLRGE